MMRRIVQAALLFGLAACARQGGASRSDEANAPVAAEPIMLDGAFGDWRGISPLLASRSASPLDTLWITDSPHYLYVSLAFRDSVNLQAMAGTLHLLLSPKEAGAFGQTVYGVPNVTASVDFSRLDKVQAGPRGAGFSVRPVVAQGLGAFVSPYVLDIVAMPTWASPRFELRIARVPLPQLGFLGSQVDITPVFVTTDSAVHRSPTTAYRMHTRASLAPHRRADSIPSPQAGVLRVAQWNVSEGSFGKPEIHARLLAAVTPDVLMLDELPGQVTPDDLRRFFDLPALRALGHWNFVLAGTGGRQRTAVASRGYAIRPVEGMTAMHYAPGALDSLRRHTPVAGHLLIGIEEAAQISSVGAWVKVRGTEVMFVPLDLQSGGYAGSLQDHLRVLQAEAIRGYLRAEEAQRNAFPLVIAGDFNPVGSYRSVALLSHELFRMPGMVQSSSARLGERSLATWRSEAGAQFAPGQLDFTFFRGLRQRGGFIFTTEDLTDRLLASLGLTREASPRTSDHLIVVTDLIR